MKILRFKELMKILNVSRSTIDRWVKDSNFPKKLNLGANSIGWKEEDILNWINTRNTYKE